MGVICIQEREGRGRGRLGLGSEMGGIESDLRKDLSVCKLDLYYLY
jgi:hypothetical protein